MQVKVLFFGILSDKTRVNSITVKGIDNIAELKQYLNAEYPSIKGHSYLIAINQQINEVGFELKDGDEIALMPPFAGG